jgi:hypothetical protein
MEDLNGILAIYHTSKFKDVALKAKLFVMIFAFKVVVYDLGI